MISYPYCEFISNMFANGIEINNIEIKFYDNEWRELDFIESYDLYPLLDTDIVEILELTLSYQGFRWIYIPYVTLVINDQEIPFLEGVAFPYSSEKTRTIQWGIWYYPYISDLYVYGIPYPDEAYPLLENIVRIASSLLDIRRFSGVNKVKLYYGDPPQLVKVIDTVYRPQYYPCVIVYDESQDLYTFDTIVFSSDVEYVDGNTEEFDLCTVKYYEPILKTRKQVIDLHICFGFYTWIPA